MFPLWSCRSSGMMLLSVRLYSMAIVQAREARLTCENTSATISVGLSRATRSTSRQPTARPTGLLFLVRETLSEPPNPALPPNTAPMTNAGKWTAPSGRAYRLTGSTPPSRSTRLSPSVSVSAAHFAWLVPLSCMVCLFYQTPAELFAFDWADGRGANLCHSRMSQDVLKNPTLMATPPPRARARALFYETRTLSNPFPNHDDDDDDDAASVMETTGSVPAVPVS